MQKIYRTIFIIIFIFSTYHLVRDVVQTLGINNIFTTIFHRPHLWCKPYCNYVTYPLDIFGIFGSLYVLKKNKVGLLGMFVLLSSPFWILAVLLP